MVATYYLQWGRLAISLANLVVIAVTVAVFVLAIFLPNPFYFRRGR